MTGVNSIDIKAQVPKTCNMCEETIEVKYRCLECNFILCERCRRFHEKIKTVDFHHIINIKDDSASLTKLFHIPMFPCLLHKEENCVLYCLDCEETACTSCISIKHQKHTLENLKTYYLNKTSEIENGKERIEQSILPSLNRRQKRLEHLIIFHTQKYEKAKQKIYKWEKYMKESIANVLENQRVELIQRLDYNFTGTKETILPEISKLKTTKKDIEDILINIDTVMSCGDVKRVNDVRGSLQLQLVEVTSHTEKVRAKIGNFCEKEIGALPFLGEIKFKDIFQMKLVSCIQTKLTCIDKIISLESGIVLLRNLENNMIHKIKIDSTKNTFYEYEKFELDVKDISALNSGDIIFISPDKSDIRTITSKLIDFNHRKDFYDSTTFYQTHPQIPTAIHVSPDNNIIICTVEPSRESIPMDEPCHVEIYILTSSGKQISRFEFNRDLFCFPDKISSISEMICIADSISDYSSRVVTLNKSGEVKWIYGDTSTSVIISDMVHTPLRNLVILQVCQSKLQVLDPDGERLRILDLTNLNITHPYCLSIYNDNYILVGCGANDNNLHILEYIES
ncbi:unnamed protein product [Mytilus coruscus]|uniref:B box-type domain-containing protein n=1 Tax=Mytilus coruscus TaxID=42192 RepID=A0A6J8C9K5_MYTCO|nr:unnamed protein product [Mytilus coruscus]